METYKKIHVNWLKNFKYVRKTCKKDHFDYFNV